MSATIESFPDGSLQVRQMCEHCGDDVAWDHVAFTDAGKLLVGHCLCPGERHSYGLGPRDRVVDGHGRRL